MLCSQKPSCTSGEHEKDFFPTFITTTQAVKRFKVLNAWACGAFVNDRQTPTVGPGKDLKKNGRRRFNGPNSRTKRDIVMGPKAKMVPMHRPTNTGQRKNQILAKMH